MMLYPWIEIATTTTQRVDVLTLCNIHERNRHKFQFNVQMTAIDSLEGAGANRRFRTAFHLGLQQVECTHVRETFEIFDQTNKPR